MGSAARRLAAPRGLTGADCGGVGNHCAKVRPASRSSAHRIGNAASGPCRRRLPRPSRTRRPSSLRAWPSARARAKRSSSTTIKGVRRFERTVGVRFGCRKDENAASARRGPTIRGTRAPVLPSELLKRWTYLRHRGPLGPHQTKAAQAARHPRAERPDSQRGPLPCGS